MVLHRLAMALALSTLAATPARADDAPSLAPSSPWNLVYDDDSCALRRTFGSGRDQAYLEFRRFAPGWGLQTTLASRRPLGKSHPNVRYRFTDDEEWRNPGIALSISLEDGLKGVIIEPSLAEPPAEVDAITNGAERDAYFQSFDYRAFEKQQAAAIDSLTVRGLGPEFTLRLGKLEAPIGALQDCVDELMTHWNIDVEAHKTLTQRAWPVNWSAGSRMLDYPPKMERQRMPGLVNVRLAIDATGKITGCRIQMPLSDPAFEESSCADIQHAFEFEPALDKDGKPIASYWTTRVIFTF